ncbi:unnamed protein product [Pylaiella littoralis]
MTGILNETVSICSDPSVKTTIFLENNYKYDGLNIKDYSAKDALLNTPNIENPFNVNRQGVILDFVRKNYSKNSIDIIDSDIFYLARFDLIVSKEQNLYIFEKYATSVLKKWLKDVHNLTEEKFKFIQEKAEILSKEYLEFFNEDMQSDIFLQHVSLFSYTILLFLEMNPTVLFGKKMYETVFESFTEYFNTIETNFVKKSNKRKLDYEQEDHSESMGMLVTYLADALNFHRISTIEGIVLISYGQHHAETFENIVVNSNWYTKGFSYGETLDYMIF